MIRYTMSLMLLPLIWLNFFKDSSLKGNYKMIFNKKYGDTSRLVVPISMVSFIDSTYYRKLNNEIIDKGKISIQHSGDRITAHLISSIRYDSVGSLDSLLNKSFGAIITELDGVTGDTIKFRTTYSGNLHISIDNGILVKIK